MANANLVNEIISARESYLRQGGNNAEILRRMSEQEQNARNLLQRKHAAINKTPPFNGSNSKPTYALDLRDLEERVHDIEQRTAKDLQRKVPIQQMTGENGRPGVFADSERSFRDNALISRDPMFNYRTQSETKHLPYYPETGLLLLYDFVTGLREGLAADVLRVSVTLFRGSEVWAQFPPVYPQRAVPYLVTSTTFIGAKQPVFGCTTDTSVQLLIELQTIDHQSSYSGASHADQGSFETVAWTIFPLFCKDLRLRVGKWRVPFRKLPIALPTIETSSLPSMYESAEFCLRLVNGVNDEHDYSPQTSPGGIAEYQYLNEPPVPAVIKNIDNRHEAGGGPVRPEEFIRSGEPRANAQPNDEDTDTIGFLIDKVRGLTDQGSCKARLSAYYRTTGQVVESQKSPMTCITTAVESTFRYRTHMFGDQEAVFEDIQIRDDMLLVARIYLAERRTAHAERKGEEGGREEKMTGGGGTSGGGEKLGRKQSPEYRLVAWAAIPLVNTRSPEYIDGIRLVNVNTGFHTLQLHKPPVPSLGVLPLPGTGVGKGTVYPGATLHLSIFTGTAVPAWHTSASPVPGITGSEDDALGPICPRMAWISHERLRSPTDPFTLSDGFDLYIDGCRHLPDPTTVVWISFRLVCKSGKKVGPAAMSIAKLESPNLHNPVFGYRVEFREPNLPPTSTLLLKVYTMDKRCQRQIVIGYSAVKIFVETGSERQPISDTGTQISLNEGGHQLRIFQNIVLPSEGEKGEREEDKGSMSSELSLTAGRPVPCSTILVRLVKAPIGSDRKPLEADRVPFSDWSRLGLLQPIPAYSDGVYLSTRCRPTRGECLLYDALMQRDPISVKDFVLASLTTPGERKMLTVALEIQEFLRAKVLDIIDSPAVDLDMSFISSYNPVHGIMFVVDRALNLPWRNFTQAHYCLNPPAAFYSDEMRTFDKLTFSGPLDLNSNTSSPQWSRKLTHFADRSYNQFLTMIVQLCEVTFNVTPDGYKYEIKDKFSRRFQGRRFKTDAVWCETRCCARSALGLKIFSLQYHLTLSPWRCTELRILTTQPPDERRPLLSVQAWTVINIFNEDFACTGYYQLPLFEGEPSQAALHELSETSVKDWLNTAAQNNSISLMRGASVFIRVCDGRRDDEISSPTPDLKKGIKVNVEYLPENMIASYKTSEDSGREISSIVPPGTTPEQFLTDIAEQFETLVYIPHYRPMTGGY